MKWGAFELLVVAGLLVAIGCELYAVYQTPLQSALGVVQIGLNCLLLVYLWLTRPWIPNRWFSSHTPSFLFIAALLSVLFLWHEDTPLSSVITTSGNALNHFVLFVCVAGLLVSFPERILFVFKCIAVLTAFLCLPTIVGALGVDGLGHLTFSNKEQNRFMGLVASGGILSHSLSMASLTVMATIAVFMVYAQGGSACWLLLLPLFLVALFCTNGRAAFVQTALVYGLILPPVVLGIRSKMFTYLAAGLMLALVIAGSVLLLGVDEIRLLLRLEQGGSRRDELWDYALAGITESPWGGHGTEPTELLGQSNPYLGGFDATLQAMGYGNFHNKLIDLAYGFGLPVSLLYLWVLAWETLGVRRAERLTSYPVMRVAFVGSLVFLLLPLTVPYSIGGVRFTSASMSWMLGLFHVYWFNALSSSKGLLSAHDKAMLDSHAAA
jgi:hypothetical protein